MPLLLWLLLLILVAVGALYVYLTWHFNHWKRRGVKGPQARPIAGTFPKSRAGRCNLIEELHEIYLDYKSTDRFVGVFSARAPKLFILDPELAMQILTRSFKSFADNESSQWTSPAVEKLRVCSPFVSTGGAWRERRAELTPALSASRLRLMHAALNECGERLVNFMDGHVGASLDAKELASRFTAEFMAMFIWDAEADAFTPETPTGIHSMARSMITQALMCVRYYTRTAPLPWLRALRPVRFFSTMSDRFFQTLAMDTMQTRQLTMSEHSDVMNHLAQLKVKKSLSDTLIAGHTTTVLIDGFETGAILIAHCLLLLARNPREQQKLRQEVLEAGEGITYEALNGLTYLDQCLQETLRIFPALPTLFKLCTEETVLENLDGSTVTLKPNDAVYISSYSFHHDADYFERPEDFWPERFDDAFGGVRKYRNLGVFLPFGEGPRMCPGMKLGMSEAKMAVFKVVQHFEVRMGPRTRKDNKIAANSFLLGVDGRIELVFDRVKLS